jgi:hypothetical protein
MDHVEQYQTLRIEVRPSPETNDHEVLFIADGVDLIARHWSDMMGLDPDDILIVPCPLIGEAEARLVTVVRCNCGVLGCGRVEVEIRRSLNRVVWECAEYTDVGHPTRLEFAAQAYDAEIQRALKDHSWETPDRTAARLLGSIVDRDILARSQLTFLWASGRIHPGVLSVALMLKSERGPGQILVHVMWSGQTPDEIARECAEILKQPPETWPLVDWHPQHSGPQPPPFDGPGWPEDN